MNQIFDQAERVQLPLSEPTSNQDDLTNQWFKQQDWKSLRLGRRADYPNSTGPGHCFSQWDYLHHYDGAIPPQDQHPLVHGAFEQGTRLTKFKTGMYRRNYKDIQQDRERLDAEARKAAWKAQHDQRRMANLDYIDKKNGFNVINGVETHKPYHWRPSVRKLSEENSAVFAREGLIRLRNSTDRFFVPAYTGPRHNYRQHQLLTEGVLLPKMTSILGWGRRELLSIGADEQFGKSNYTPNDPCRVESLFDMREPGRYTPAKTGRSKYIFNYPLHHRIDVAIPPVLRGPSPRSFTSTTNSNITTSTVAATTNPALMSHDHRRDMEQQRKDIEEVRNLPQHE